jgi:hypothetical protein
MQCVSFRVASAPLVMVCVLLVTVAALPSTLAACLAMGAARCATSECGVCPSDWVRALRKVSRCDVFRDVDLHCGLGAVFPRELRTHEELEGFCPRLGVGQRNRAGDPRRADVGWAD